ncbi:MAG: substrate-binding domain-containing protein [Desulfobulbaceae bacterium]|nr:substrate-binding domain-containing protein [Desulfobulbaceae bacterium]
MRNMLRGFFIAFLFGIFFDPAFAAEQIRYHGSSTVVSVVTNAVTAFNKKEGIVIDVKSKSSGVGVEKLLAGECDIAGVGRPLTDELRARGLVATKLFSDAYVVIVNEHVPLKSLDTKQLGDLVTGKITSWVELIPGNDYKIKVVAPPPGSAHYQNFQQMFAIQSLPQGAIVADMTPFVMDKVGQHPRAIGWLSYSTLHRSTANKAKVKMLGIQTGAGVVLPTADSVRSNAYPFIEEQYIYTKGEPAGNVKKFIDFLKGSGGREIIVKTGFFFHES